MSFKRRKTEEAGHFPSSVAACFFDDKGALVVPAEAEEYYVQVWAWKRSRLNTLEAYKRKYLEVYEKKNGKVKFWRDPTGALRPI